MSKKSLIAISLILIFTFILSISAISAGVYAASQNENGDRAEQVKTRDMERPENGSSTDEEASSSEYEVKQQGEEQDQEEADIEEHRSAVSKFVQGLLDVADREGGIGKQVKDIAREQDQSASTTVEAVKKVQSRSKWQTFFFGSDYKNLGTLRSEIAQTKNRLDQLDKLIENAQNASDKTELQNQAKTLEQEQQKIENFVNANENKFSLLGWFVKLFNR